MLQEIQKGNFKRKKPSEGQNVEKEAEKKPAMNNEDYLKEQINLRYNIMNPEPIMRKKKKKKAKDSDSGSDGDGSNSKSSSESESSDDF